MKQKIAVRCALMALILLGWVLPAQSVDVTFHGTLVVPPPCEINGNNDISVVFGEDLLISRIDGANYEYPVSYVMDCTGATSSTLKLQFQGAGAGFDASVLNTSKTGLGLELRSDGVKLPVNTWLTFTDPTRPRLTVTPVKGSGNTLSGGAFTATSTLVVDYQ